MPDEENHIDAADCYLRILSDPRVNGNHIRLFCTLLEIWKKKGYLNPFRTSRREIRQHSFPCSIVTYHKYMKDLVWLGYITYTPSYHPGLGSGVEIR